MALTRDKIIKSALRTVGQTYDYNDNSSETYQLAIAILDDVLQSIAYRTDLKFNLTTVTLTVNGTRGDEIRYNIPEDFLNKIRFVGGEAEFEGEFIYSTAENLQLKYMRSLPLTEYPDYMYEITSLLLALKLSESDPSYADKLQLLDTRVEQELQRLYKTQYTPKTRDI